MMSPSVPHLQARPNRLTGKLHFFEEGGCSFARIILTKTVFFLTYSSRNKEAFPRTVPWGKGCVQSLRSDVDGGVVGLQLQ